MHLNKQSYRSGADAKTDLMGDTQKISLNFIFKLGHLYTLYSIY